jgi:ABC-type transport system substrate-binding protein
MSRKWGRSGCTKPNGTGPYKLKEWKSFEYITYEANQDFYLGAPSIPYVLVKLYAGDGVRLYETGEVDLTGVGLYSAERMLNPEEPLNSNCHGCESLHGLCGL